MQIRSFPDFFVATTMRLHQLVGSSTGALISSPVSFSSFAFTFDFMAWVTNRLFPMLDKFFLQDVHLTDFPE